MKENSTADKQLLETIEQAETHVRSMKNFYAKFYDKIPEGLGILVMSNPPVFSVDLQFVEDEDRNRALAIIGEVFSRNDWKATLDYYGKGYNWAKSIEGIRITISHAQKLDRQESFPVPPTAFPLQLMNA